MGTIEQLRAVSWRLVYYEDAVAHLPPHDFGWRHVGTEVWYDRTSQHYAICVGGEQGEGDPACSLSKPGFKLSQDHFSYFGLCGGCHVHRGLYTQFVALRPALR